MKELFYLFSCEKLWSKGRINDVYLQDGAYIR